MLALCLRVFGYRGEGAHRSIIGVKISSAYLCDIFLSLSNHFPVAFGQHNAICFWQICQIFLDKLTNNKKIHRNAENALGVSKVFQIWALLMKAKELKDWTYKAAEKLELGCLFPVLSGQDAHMLRAHTQHSLLPMGTGLRASCLPGEFPSHLSELGCPQTFFWS